MKRLLLAMVPIAAGLTLLAAPALLQAQPDQAEATAKTTDKAKPAGPQLIREGDLAVKLQIALGVGTSEDEVEAETRLAELGIAPRNGWVANYPVTPDIIGELYKAVRDAAAGDKLSMSIEVARQRLSVVINDLGLAIKPADKDKRSAAGEPYPNPPDDSYFYGDEGPPIVSYYRPPPDYFYLYAWVPYPFWWTGLWFSGYYILNDFHRPIYRGNSVIFYSNHYNDIRRHRVFRIDPYQRYRGNTYYGIGPTRRGGLSTGVPRSDRTIFNGYRARGYQDGRPARGDGGTGFPQDRGGRGGDAGQVGGGRR